MLQCRVKYSAADHSGYRSVLSFFTFAGEPVCQLAYIHYHGISEYQFYTALKCIKEDRIPQRVASVQELQFHNQKTTECNVFLSQIVAELAEDLPMGFNLEFPHRVCGRVLFFNLNITVHKIGCLSTITR